MNPNEYNWAWDEDGLEPDDEDFYNQYKCQLNSQTMGYITDMGSSGGEWIFTIEKDGYYYDSSEYDLKFSSYDQVTKAAQTHFENLK